LLKTCFRKIIKISSAVLFLFLFLFILNGTVAADQLTLTNGKSYRGEILTNSFSLKTEYAEINIQTQYLSKITRKNTLFILKAAENNKFSGQLQGTIKFRSDSQELNINLQDLSSLDFSQTAKFSNNKAVSVSLTNNDYFSANTVENGININTSLGSPLNIPFSKLISIEYLAAKDVYLIKRQNDSAVEATFSQNKIVLWPAAGEIFELNLNYLKKMTFNN
jgi:hypothetical protein